MRALIAASLFSWLAVGASAGPEAVVYVDVAKRYQGALWAGPGMPGTQPGTGSGTGFVIDPKRFLEGSGLASCAWAGDDVLVVTNEHVARGATELIVTLFDEGDASGRSQVTVPAEVLVADQRVDVAILRLSAATLRERGTDPGSIERLAPWAGEPSSLPRGAAVQAYGNPEGLRRVMTTGIVSAALQTVADEHPYLPPVRVVQTDAAINEGNSGGPLLLAETGEVVGVNAFGGGQNLNFAIPVSRIRTLLRQAACGTGVRHGSLPVRTAAVDDRARSVMNVPSQAGVIVLRTLEGLTCLEELDVVIDVTGDRQLEAGGGSATVSLRAGGAGLHEALFDLEPGTPARLRVIRQGKPVEVECTVQAIDLQGMEEDDALLAFGAWLERPSKAVRARKGLTGDGLLCGHVEPGSPAAEAGLAIGDVVLKVLLRNGTGLRTVDVTTVPASRAALAELEESLRGSRAQGGAVVLAFDVDDTQWRMRRTRIARWSGGGGAAGQ